ncbi:ras guanine-nucleotide exchange protein Cdc25p [Massarina eburnea CBS 473.64]|uniref:Ras guanine-nucleotide exchange protein Cdc25p n=1 Tax=Massarina eburnea CBS 473.64 TaxID=1395130 RepID=A0A6A6RPJ2_9PLEO|nr:ras guanine-nucleotide exchange protein Cdc25p [Massarina eburnea CBS 473.64]
MSEDMADFLLPRDDVGKHASALVAPLNIQKQPRNQEKRHSRQSSSKGGASIKSQSQSQSQSQISPPLTPRSSRESLEQIQASLPVFHNYLRAFYHFHPSSTVTSSTDESSITVPISQGDVILVHSVHPNGWADGTLLASGARGWLPTNYCEPYDHPTIRSLLNSLTNLWDLVREGENGDLFAFTKQDYVRGMIAGVRFFLEKTECLTRDSSLIVAHVGLRRMRKGLLGDLSSLVKAAKRLQDILQSSETPVFPHLDEIVLKAFKLVTRAVRFLDIWAQDAVSLSFDLGDGSNNRPLTPPSDSVDPTVQAPTTPNHNDADVTPTNEDASSVSPTNATATHNEMNSANQPPRIPGRLSVAFSLPSDSDALQSPVFPPSLQTHGHRLSITHRLSYSGKSQGARKQSLASERLNAAHDAFLGFIGSFIGLHLQSRSSEELTLTTQESVIACRKLLAVVEEVWERDSRRSEPLEQAREVMYTRLTDLVQATKDMFGGSQYGLGEEVVMPEAGKQLVDAATSCVRSAGDCVAKARLVIERIGDFEFEIEDETLSKAVFDQIAQAAESESKDLEAPQPSEPASEPGRRPSEHTLETEKPLPAPPIESDERKMPPPPLVISESKPLPRVPQQIPNSNALQPGSPMSPPLGDSPTLPSFRMSRTSLPPLQQVPTSHLPQSTPSEYSQSPASATRRFFPKGVRADSVNASVADSSSSYRYSMRGDTGSIISLTSTRATTPEHSPSKKRSSQAFVSSSFGSVSELHSVASEDLSAAEEHLLETTFAHELVYNKEGQITGGSLPALVEQLTTHESTPDIVFVSAFYLTFRLFTTPIELAQCLINRFDYIGDSKTVGVPVRLRVYNVFKGWLESHWVSETDSAALGIIFSFATGKLRTAIPHAGKRLAELTSKVTEVRAGALVPRLASSLNKAHIFLAPDGHTPAPLTSRSQINALKAWKEGQRQCMITEFNPQEVARQLTIIESRLFCSIQPEELLCLEWQKKTGSKAVNVRAMTALANDLANLVADSILIYEDIKKRATVIKHWVKIGMFCLELHNYDSLMAIVCSLNSSMVQRLKKTWEVVSANTKSRLEELKTVTEVGRNYTVLRQRLQTVVEPCIPFIGFYLTDLTFIHEGNSTTRLLHGESDPASASVINFDKYMKTARIIDQIQSFQQPHRLAPVPEMQEWMESQIQRVRSSEQANVQSYYRRSLLLEPREPPQVVKAAAAGIEDGAPGALSADHRTTSKERFDFRSFHFSTNVVKERPT